MSRPSSEQARREQAAVWNVVSLIMAGVAFWGGVGWLVSRWLENQFFVMLGVLLGAGAAIYLVWVRYGKA